MNLIDILTPDCIELAVDEKSKKRVLERLGVLISTHGELDEQLVFDSLVDRERLGSTGIGNGVAIPHGRIADLMHPVGAFIQLHKGINFDAVDKQPVDLVFGLIVPQSTTHEHSELLNSLVQQCNNAAWRAALREAKDKTTILQLMRTNLQ